MTSGKSSRKEKYQQKWGEKKIRLTVLFKIIYGQTAT